MNEQVFFTGKGIVAFIALMLYVFHLWQIRNKQMPNDQMWRFLALFLGAAVVFYGSYEQIQDTVEIEPRNVGGLIFAIVTFIAAVKSIRAERRRMNATKGTS